MTSYPRLVKALKIGWTAACGICCVLLVVLWVRSYWCKYIISLNSPSAVQALVMCGYGDVHFRKWGSSDTSIWRGQWHFESQATSNLNEHKKSIGFQWLDDTGDPFGSGMVELAVPLWFPAVVLAVSAVFPNLIWRFSLRTMLLATTVAAVILGVIVLAARV